MEVYIKYEYDYLSIDFYGENKNIQKITKDFNIINFVTILRDILSWYVSVGMLVKTFLYEWILCLSIMDNGHLKEEKNVLFLRGSMAFSSNVQKAKGSKW